MQTDIKTLGALKASGYKSKSIRQEMQQNLRNALQKKSDIFSGIVGYDNTVIPDVQRAILSGHNILLLGLRGQAKTRIARQMTNLLDEYIPVIKGSLLQEDPLQPISAFAKDFIKDHGDDTPIEWLHKSERYTEKLATPDVTVADLIGDVDPIKAMNEKLDFSDERVLQYGLIPRSHRGLFVINELPDLQPRIQVALFNILQEGDIQIRGFKLRLPLDIQFVFTANPEDYTNRGSIVTPLKDRIGSQILTHYPKTLEESKAITTQEAKGENEAVLIPTLARDLLEEVAIQARESEFVDEKSGVSARLTISAFENLVSAAERRMLLNGEDKTTIRLSDFNSIFPAITGKIELVYEGEQEGSIQVAEQLLGKAIRKRFEAHLPKPDSFRKTPDKNPYRALVEQFYEGGKVDFLFDEQNADYQKKLNDLPELKTIAEQYFGEEANTFHEEFILHGLAEYSLLGKQRLEKSTQFGDLLGGMMEFDDM